MPHRLAELFDSAGIELPPGLPERKVAGVGYDSRRVRDGDIFVCVAGFHVDGHHYAAAAADAGAAVVVAEHMPDPPPPSQVPLVLVPDSRVALAQLAAAAAGHPSRQMTVAGVTGTDGKTTTSTMIWAALRAAGRRAASLTTVDVRTDAEIEPNTTRQTTLEAVELQQQLSRMCAAGVTDVAIETSSHSLALHRVDGVDYRFATFTRITSEHLELHGTREAYRDAKARLIDLASRHRDGCAILDADDDFAYPALRQHPIPRRISYSVSGNPATDVTASGVVSDENGVRFTAHTPWGRAPVELRLAGRFNVANALAAISTACAADVALADAVAGISGLERVSGRMERVVLGQDFTVVIDYAHTAEALAKVLGELRAATTGALWVVFGSAGERDRAKRPEMGRVAAELADRIVITDEDPRDEDRHAILREIAAGAEAGGATSDRVTVIADRPAAIDYAVMNAAPGDSILLAGKGHESNMLVAGGSVPYSERGVAEAAVRRRLRLTG